MADEIKIGNLEISSLKVGSYDCEVYLGDVKVYPSVKTIVVTKFNVTSTSSPTQLCYDSAVSQFSRIEIDDVVQPSVVSAYTFSTTGEHTVKYTLKDPTIIGSSAFYNCSGMTACTIGSGVTSIGSSAFASCSGLTSIDIPSGVTSIGESVFSSCSGLTTCTIGSGVTSISSGAFYNCRNLTSVTIPDSVTSIGNQAFRNCSRLTSIVIPNSVTSIGTYAFNGCSGLTSITCNATTAPTIGSSTFRDVKTRGTLTVPIGSSGYDVWMGTGDYYLGKYNWTKVEQ